MQASHSMHFGATNTVSAEYGAIAGGTNNSVSNLGGYIGAGGYNTASGEGAVVGQLRITEVIDKGLGKGALVLTERKVIDKDGGKLIATVTQTIFCRGDGGFGGPPREAPAPHPIPTSDPDAVCDLATRPEAALIYRLSGDRNPLHAEPAVAKQAGYPRPIMHGLGNFGVAGHAVLKTFCGYDPKRLTSFACRFSAPVFPGETLRTEMWRDGNVVSFRSRVVERDIVAVNNGRAEVRP